MTVIAAEEITDITTDDVEVSERHAWGDETYSVGVTGNGQEVVVIESSVGTEIFAVNGKDNARQWMKQQMAASMRASEDPSSDITLSWPANHTDADFAGTRTDATSGIHYSVVRHGNSIEIAPRDTAEEALEAAASAARIIALTLGDDPISVIGRAHLLARANEVQARMYRAAAGAAIRQAKRGGVIGRTGEITVTELADRLGASRGLVHKVISGEDWS